jgi:hypothetical protein
MKQTTTENVTRTDLINTVEAYLKARQSHHKGETIGTFLFHLYKSGHAAEKIEETSILISEALAVFSNQYVHQHIAGEMGEHWIAKLSYFLSDLNKVLLYMASCKTAMTSVYVNYLHNADDPEHWSQEVRGRIKREYEIRLQRLKDGEDFE